MSDWEHTEEKPTPIQAEWGLTPHRVRQRTIAAEAERDALVAQGVRLLDERDALAARVEELEARIARATAVLERTASWDDRITRALVALERPIGSAETWAQYGDNRSNAARRILRGEDER